MNDLYDALRRLAEDPEARGVLAEVEATEGSAPRKAGAQMLLGPDGTFSGTIGGGGLEFIAQQEAKQVLERGEPLRRTYSLGSAPGEATGAICGGNAAISFRVIGAAEAKTLLADLPQTPRVMIFGAGHVGKALADALALLGLSVTAADPRPELLTPERFPRAELCLFPEDHPVVDARENDYIVILTHSHALDYALLRLAMATPARYVGMIGSRRKSVLFRKRLAADGVDPGQIEARLRTPVGIPIGAETPEEIAVSIAAEIIADLRR